MAYNINEIMTIAQKLQLQNLEDTCNCAIEGLTGVGKNLKVLVLTTHNVVGKSFLKECLGLSLNATNRLYPCEISYKFGECQYAVNTSFGEVNVDEETLLKHLSTSGDGLTQASVFNKLFVNNIDIDFLYIESFDALSYNEWILKLAAVDKIYYLLDGLQIFNEKEKSFSDGFVDTIFADNRNAFVVGNSHLLNQNEYKEVINYSKQIIGDNCRILISNEGEQSFETLKSDLSALGSQTLEIRSALEPNLTKYMADLLCAESMHLKEELLHQSINIEDSIAMLSSNSQIVEESKEHIKRKVDSYITEYAYILFEKRVYGFNNLLLDSLAEDINQSQNIDEDAKWINKYLEFIWTKFMSEQESWLKSTITKEITDIEAIINSDLNMLVNQLDIESQRLIKDYVMAKYNVHSFLIGKEGKTSVGELSKTLKLGSAILVLFSPLLALVTFGGSELVKKMFGDKFASEKKENLITSVMSTSKQMVDQILQQANSQFEIIASEFKKQAMVVYDNLLSELSNVLTSKQRSASETEEMLAVIAEIENTYPEAKNNH